MDPDPLGIVQEIEIWPYYQMVYIQKGIRPSELDAKNSLWFWDKNKSYYPGVKTRLGNCQQKKMKTCQIVDFADQADYKV